MLLPYKDDNPTSKPPIVTVAIIAINVAVFLYFQAKSLFGGVQYEAVLAGLGIIPHEFFSRHIIFGRQAVPTPLTLITAMFLHGGVLHIAGNMLYLWVFGNNIEDHFGHFKFLVFYLLAGIGGSIAFMVTQPFSDTPMIGASGAIAGVLGAYLLLYPRARVHVLLFLFIFFTTIVLPAAVVLGFWIFLQVWEGLADFSSRGGVAYFAHIGGFCTGIALLKFMPAHRGIRQNKITLQ